MDISAVGQNQNLINSEIKAEQAEQLYYVKLAKMQQEEAKVAGNIIQDTVEISQEAMNKFWADRGLD